MAREYIVKLPDGEELGPYEGQAFAKERARAVLDRGRLPNGTEVVEVEPEPDYTPPSGPFAVSCQRITPPGVSPSCHVVCQDTGRVRATRQTLEAAQAQADEWNSGGVRTIRDPLAIPPRHGAYWTVDESGEIVAKGVFGTLEHAPRTCEML